MPQFSGCLGLMISPSHILKEGCPGCVKKPPYPVLQFGIPGLNPHACDYGGLDHTNRGCISVPSRPLHQSPSVLHSLVYPCRRPDDGGCQPYRAVPPLKRPVILSLHAPSCDGKVYKLNDCSKIGIMNHSYLLPR